MTLRDIDWVLYFFFFSFTFFIFLYFFVWFIWLAFLISERLHSAFWRVWVVDSLHMCWHI